MMFTEGKIVEVSFEKETLRDCWFPATILRILDNNTFEVKFQQFGCGDKGILYKFEVSYPRIRPPPPHLRHKNYVLLENVDAYCDFGWWSGVITKELADNRYNVSLKNSKKEIEFSYSSLRPHMEWKDGKWFNAPQDDMDGRTLHSLIDEQLEQTTTISIDEVSTVTKSITKKTNQENHHRIDAGSPLSNKLQDEIMNDDSSQQTNRVILSPVSVSEKVGSESVAQKRKRGRPPKSLSLKPIPPVTFFAEDSQIVSKEKPDESFEKDSATRIPEASDDHLLSRWFEDLPFVRNTSLWKIIISMEAFRKLPQTPHFRPLLKNGVKECAREGLAIGTMVKFSTVIDMTCGLRFNDPKSIIEDCLETLVELENNGFDVEVIRDRLTKLLLLKDKQDELAKRSKGVVEKIEEHNVQGTRNDEEIEAIDREIRELEEKRKHVVLNKDKWSLEFGVMEAMFKKIEEETMRVCEEFDGLVGTTLTSL